MSEERFVFVKSLDDNNCFIMDTIDKQIYINEQIADFLNYLNEVFKVIPDELYVPIECCDKDE